jgi:hypothetical protein
MSRGKPPPRLRRRPRREATGYGRATFAKIEE